ncbi:ParB N-terminal domain-containing protein [Sulfitobacter sp. 1A12157]|jgi:hypothetical protein|uniref:ParB N-terminal domain-containing protein n=1 Tax=Sulfitobacter sp. 1A12157 TaxID=3368594 RepID=UPI003746162D
MSENIIQDIKTDEIFLDEKNPRLPTTTGRKQQDMLVYIARNTSITELMSAIAENGYFPGEPIVVVPRDEGGFWAVEGNRRLTAVKLLQDPSLHPKNSRVREISEQAKHKPTSIPCVIFKDRIEVVNYLGYRHISGVKQWEPLAKARYIAEYFELHTDQSQSPAERYREVARGIGSQAPFIKRQLDGMAFYRHIEDRGFYEIEGLNEETISFSLVTTALGYDSLLKFVSHDPDPFLNPSKLDEEAVSRLTHWMFEQGRAGETILGESRNIQRLAVVVEDKDALAFLVSDRNLEKSYALTKGVAVDFYDLLSAIEGQLGEAVSSVALVDLDEGHQNKIGNIFKQARLLRSAAED